MRRSPTRTLRIFSGTRLDLLTRFGATGAGMSAGAGRGAGNGAGRGAGNGAGVGRATAEFGTPGRFTRRVVVGTALGIVAATPLALRPVVPGAAAGATAPVRNS
ncbi:MAG: hypothetical protein EBT86_02440 [Actinobacteria bacterium]|nr:hypothetical protein [Actinomycetota bacterium]